jgi:hypothetical protein
MVSSSFGHSAEAWHGIYKGLGRMCAGQEVFQSVLIYE